MSQLMRQDKNHESALEAHELEKQYGATTVVSRFNVDIPKGQTVVLWGPNGAGKTTILQCFLGMLRYHGTLSVLGQEVKKSGKCVRQSIGYVPQDIRLHTDLTVEETLSFYAQLKNVIVKAPQLILEKWNLIEARKKCVYALSGGMRQKLALAIALLSDPPILFLDEATSNLDLKTRSEFLNQLYQLKQAGKTLVICSHHISEVRQLADQVVVLNNGETVATGSLEEVQTFLKNDIILSLSLRHEDYSLSKELLRKHGFQIKTNGSQLLIKMDETRKGELFEILSQSRIPVLDFDIETH